MLLQGLSLTSASDADSTQWRTRPVRTYDGGLVQKAQPKTYRRQEWTLHWTAWQGQTLFFLPYIAMQWAFCKCSFLLHFPFLNLYTPVLPFSILLWNTVPVMNPTIYLVPQSSHLPLPLSFLSLRNMYSPLSLSPVLGQQQAKDEM